MSGTIITKKTEVSHEKNDLVSLLNLCNSAWVDFHFIFNGPGKRMENGVGRCGRRDPVGAG